MENAKIWGKLYVHNTNTVASHFVALGLSLAPLGRCHNYLGTLSVCLSVRNPSSHSKTHTLPDTPAILNICWSTFRIFPVAVIVLDSHSDSRMNRDLTAV